MFTGFDFDVIERSLPYLFREGMTFTLTLTAMAMSGGIVFGTLLAMMRLSSYRLLNVPAAAYVNLMRSVPLVLVIFWFYFLVPYIGAWAVGAKEPIQVGAFWSSVITFTLFEAAYYAEIMRAGIQSVPRGQVSAGQALGLNYWQHMGYIVLPQAFRIVMPPLTSEFMNIIKNSSVALTIGLVELTARARSMQEFTFQVFEAFTAATLIYIVITLIVVFAMRYVERKVAVPGLISAGGAPLAGH